MELVMSATLRGRKIPPLFLASVDCTIVFLQMQIKTYTSKVGLETNTRWQLPLYYKFLDPTSYFLNQSWRLQHLVESFAGETPDSGPCRLRVRRKGACPSLADIMVMNGSK